MRRILILENLKNFLISKPPTVLFLICLFCFIVALSSLVELIRTSEHLANPDDLDWNTFREKLSRLDFCINLPVQLVNVSSSFSSQQQQTEMMDKRKNSYSYQVEFLVDYSGNMSELERLTVIIGEIDLFQIGWKKETLDVRLKINKLEKSLSGNCDKNTLLDKKCSHQYTVIGCVRLTGFSKIFPKTKAPNMCSVDLKQTKKSPVLVGQSRLSTFKETPELPLHFYCSSRNGARAKLAYSRDPDLIAWLTPSDRELICRNLAFVIFILSALIMIIILYAMISSSRAKSFLYHQATEM